MNFQLKDSRPIWLQLADQITESIVTGEYLPGERFPAVRELAMQANVNPNTMQRALARLEELGLLVTARTAGRSVTEDSRVLREMRRMLAETGRMPGRRQESADYLSDCRIARYGRHEKTRFQP